MPSLTYNVLVSCGGVTFNKSTTREADGADLHEVTLPVGAAGTVATKTDADSATFTLAGGHGISTSDIVDIHWVISGTYYVRHTCTASMSGNTLTINNTGTGDDFPAVAQAIVCTKQVTITLNIDGDAAAFILVGVTSDTANSTAHAHCKFLDSGAAIIETDRLLVNYPLITDITAGQENPYTGNVIASCKASNGSSSEVLTLKIISLQDSTA